MPRYFFNIEGDDDDGTELADDDAARVAARESFGTLITEGSVASGTSMEVLDATGRRVVALKYLEE
jgi:hypothetical protein